MDIPRPVVMLAAIAWAASQPALAQTFEELAARLEEHPSVVALRHRAESHAELAAAAVALPDPQVTLGIANLPVANPAFDRFLPTHKAIGVHQQLPARQHRQARAEHSRGKVAVTDATRRQRLATLRAELVTTLVAQRRIRDEIGLRRAQDGKYAELAEIVAAEIQAGRPLAYQLAEVDVERAETARLIALLDGETAELDARLVALAGVAASASPPALAMRAWEGDPRAFHAVRVAEAEVGVARAGVDEANAAWRPSWRLGFTYQQRQAGRAGSFPGDDWVSVNVGFSVPLWAARSQEPKARAARARAAEANSRQAAAARQALAEWRALDARRAASAGAVAILDAEIAAKNEQIAALRTNYEAGMGAWAAVIAAEISRITLEVRRGADDARRLTAIARANALQVRP